MPAGGTVGRLFRMLLATAAVVTATAAPATAQMLPADPPLATSSNVQLLGHIPGSAAGMVFTGNYAYVSGWGGITVLDIAQPASPKLVGALPLPHFENEDVDLCGNTLLVVNDRVEQDIGALMYVIDVANRPKPLVRAVLPLGLTGSGRGSGHIANFVKPELHPGVGRRRRPRRGRGPHRCRPRRGRSASSRRPPPQRLLQRVARQRARQHGHGLERGRRRRGRLQG